MNGVLMEMARAMMLECNAPIRLWGEAMNYAAFIRNNTPQPSIQGQIPCQLLFGRAYEHTKFRVFGCDALLRLQDDQHGKFQSRFRPVIFVASMRLRTVSEYTTRTRAA